MNKVTRSYLGDNKVGHLAHFPFEIQDARLASPQLPLHDVTFDKPKTSPSLCLTRLQFTSPRHVPPHSHQFSQNRAAMFSRNIASVRSPYPYPDTVRPQSTDPKRVVEKKNRHIHQADYSTFRHSSGKPPGQQPPSEPPSPYSNTVSSPAKPGPPSTGPSPPRLSCSS